MKSLSNTETPVIVLIFCVFVVKGNLYRFYLATAAGIKCRVAAVKSLPILHNNAGFIY